MESNDIKDLIREAQKSNVTVLDLSSKNLTSLPSEIFELKNLTKLDISGNQLTSLPPEISELKNLNQLDISYNQLTSLPPEISELKNLNQLNVSGNQLTSLPPEITELKNLTELYISDSMLESLPSEIGMLNNLNKLSVYGNRLRSLPSEIGELENLTIFSMSENQLLFLPSEIGKLNSLNEFHVHRNQLSSLPHEIRMLKNLTELSISNNRLSSLPLEIGELKNLTKLSASNNHLSTLPSELSELENLDTLDISYNQLTSFPLEILKMKKLTRLYISRNQLTSLPTKISKLKNLTELDISYNQLTLLPPEISKLKNLTTLNVSENQLTSLPPEILELKNLIGLYIAQNLLTSFPSGISALEKLTELDISENQLTLLPPEISKLKNLTELDISRNLLALLPPEILELKHFTKLDVSGNQLKSLPPRILDMSLEVEWVNYWKPNIVYLNGNPFENPPVEIIKQGKEAIINYFKSLEGEKEPLNEVKVLLVGEGGAGKTSLVKRLIKNEFDENEAQTHGININKWAVKQSDKKIKVNFWDFGGQEIMHATHQFFLSERSLYILVLDSRRDEKAEYWLKHIQSFGGDSPILVVINKIDENPAFDLNRKFLQEKYPSIKGFYRISCKRREGLESFSQKLREELAKIEHLQIKWPKNWFNVKTKLENMSYNFVTCDEYRRICYEENITEDSIQDTLVEFLNFLGVVVHFKDFSLLDTHVLEPKWITEAVYKIINSKKLADNHGVLRYSFLKEILRQESEADYFYPSSRYNFIINLMKKFELCYEMDSQAVLIPDLLEIQEPKFDFDLKNSLQFFIEYDFLSKSIMPRFIVKMSKDIKDNLRWRTGVVLEDKEFKSSALIKVDEQAKKIYIYVNGEQKRDYFSVILFNLREINSDFKKMKAIEKIPMPNEPDISVSYRHLIKLEERGSEKYIPDGSEFEYDVKALLGTINVKKSENESIQEILKIVRKLADESDTEDSLSEKIFKVISLNPNFMGVGIDIKELVKLIKIVSSKKK